ncbi:MAG: phenylalanine--tRNA ligase subunit beta [Pyrinomonadaceae bacterium]|nr:phenylalanine--tRNA ligase subunit beta [Pyrinomonadaceae bacterium]
MNISYNWLKDLIDLKGNAEEVARQLTRVGLAVEGIHPHGDDLVLDIDLTSNRPDCLSHLGIARELSVYTGSPVKVLTEDVPDVPMPAVLAGDIVRIDAPDICHRFTARIVRNVKIGPSPKWLVDRLEAIGERSINNVADITNYVMHELGQPMHSFDLDKLEGGRIVVRRAAAGETITTLDEVERNLDDSMLMICDAVKPAAIGGIMGGLNSSITDDTVNVLLEVAFFKRESIRSTSRKLNLTTEASYRFERGVDIDNLVRASDRAVRLICELAGGVADDLIDVYPSVHRAGRVVSNDISAAVKRLTGLTVSTDECDRILESLGITAETGEEGEKSYLSPTWRHDIAIEEDLVEEVARHTGYENIGVELPPAFGAGEYQHNEPREKRLRQTLVDQGFDEAISYSFIDTRFDGMFDAVPGLLIHGGGDRFVTLNDSVIEGAVRMRHSILPGLLDAVRLNLNFQRRDVRLFELGKAFAAVGDGEPPNEQELFALVVTGGEVHQDRAMTTRELDFYDAKGAVEAAMAAVGVTDLSFRAADVQHLRRGQAASIAVSGEIVGSLGRLSDNIAAGYKFKQPVYIAEINLQMVLGSAAKTPVYRPLPKFPGITRDVSFIAGRDAAYTSMRDAILSQGSDLIKAVDFVDVYEGKGLSEGERSITIRIEYRSDDRTLVDSEIDGLHLQVLSEIERKTRARPRF